MSRFERVTMGEKRSCQCGGQWCLPRHLVAVIPLCSHLAARTFARIGVTFSLDRSLPIFTRACSFSSVDRAARGQYVRWGVDRCHSYPCECVYLQSARDTGWQQAEDHKRQTSYLGRGHSSLEVLIHCAASSAVCRLPRRTSGKGPG